MGTFIISFYISMDWKLFENKIIHINNYYDCILYMYVYCLRWWRDVGTSGAHAHCVPTSHLLRTRRFSSQFIEVQTSNEL